jgi:hypothetical protein
MEPPTTSTKSVAEMASAKRKQDESTDNSERATKVFR